DCVAAAEGAARLLESLGHHVEASGPSELGAPEFIPQFITCWSAGNAWSIDYWTRRTGKAIGADDVEAGTWALVEMGRSYTAPQWLSTREWLQEWTRRMAAWWGG